MGDEMKQAETGMPSLTLEPDFAPEVKKEPEVQVQGQLMEVAPEWIRSSRRWHRQY